MAIKKLTSSISFILIARTEGMEDSDITFETTGERIIWARSTWAGSQC